MVYLWILGGFAKRVTILGTVGEKGISGSNWIYWIKIDGIIGIVAAIII